MRIIFFLCSFLPAIVIAQNTATLTVFSERNSPFVLYLNNIQQNDSPATHLNIENLQQPFTSVKIIFPGTATTLVKKNISVSDADNNLMHVSYKIRYEKDIPKLHFYSISRDYKVDSGSVTMSYKDGSALQSVEKISPTIVTKETSVQKKDNANVNTPVNRTVKKCTGWPLAKDDFDKAKRDVLFAREEKNKVKEAKELVSANCLMVSQVIELTKLIQSENSRLDFIKFAYAFTIDRQNYPKLKELLKNPANHTILEEITSQH